MRTAIIIALVALSTACSEAHGVGEDAGPDAARPDGGPDAARPDAFVTRDTGTDAPPTPPPDAGMPACIGTTPPSGPECATCGNGMRDSCERCMPCGPMGDCCETLEEVCDGALPPGVSCASLGYAGGTLLCGDWCSYDVRGCDGCAVDRRITRCLAAPVDTAVPQHLALAATDTSVGLAWITNASLSVGDEARVHFATFGADLSLVGETGCLPFVDARRVALATTPTGWMLAVETRAGVFVSPLGIDGSSPSGARLIAGAATPLFAERPASGPLLTYATGGGLSAQLLRDDGSVEWQTEVLSGSILEYEFGSAVFTGDGFLVSVRADGVQVVRLELDGTVTSTSMPAGSSTESPELAWTGTEARLSYAAFGGPGASMIVRLDRTGAPLGPAVELGRIPSYFNRAPMVTFGEETVVFPGDHTGGVDLSERVEVLRLDRDLRVSIAPFAVSQDPTGSRGIRVARLGTEVVVAWIGGGNGTPHFGPGELYPGRISLATIEL